MTSAKLEKLGLIDGIIAEPLGGAHRNKSAMAETLRATLTTELAALEKLAAPRACKSGWTKSAPTDNSRPLESPPITNTRSGGCFHNGMQNETPPA